MIILTMHNSTAILTLNHPENRNALHPDLVTDLKSKLRQAEEDTEVKSIIISGVGSVFCAGADLKYLEKLSRFSSIENEKDTEKLAELFLMIYKFSKPTIAAVNGPAIAGGCGLASVCDFIIAHPVNSKFGYTEVKIGFLPAIVSLFLIKRVGEGIAKQLLLSGEQIDGKRGYEIGFVNYLSDDPLKASLELADRLALNSFLSMSATKKMIQSVSNLNADDAVDYCIRLNVISRSSEDFKNALKQFVKKDN